MSLSLALLAGRLMCAAAEHLVWATSGLNAVLTTRGEQVLWQQQCLTYYNKPLLFRVMLFPTNQRLVCCCSKDVYKTRAGAVAAAVPHNNKPCLFGGHAVPKQSISVWSAVAGKMTTRGEQVLWQQQYLNCCNELGQWDLINDYAKSAENYGAFMDAAWKNNDWTVS